MKKEVISTILCAFVLVSFFQTSFSAYAGETESFVCSAEELAKIVDINEFHDRLANALLNCEENIDVSNFKIRNITKNENYINDYITYYLTEYVNCVDWYLYGDRDIESIVPEYKTSYNTKSKFLPTYKKIMSVTNYLLRDLENNSALTQVQKALLVHDRLVAYMEYGTSKNGNEFTLYGPMIEAKGVCEGYSIAYSYLMNRLGINTIIVSSPKMNHAWNITEINGVPYYVDCTWDDPLGGYEGYVLHENFLRSQDGIESTGHIANGNIDYEPIYSMDNKKYDNYYWKKSQAEFQLVGGKLYYINFDKGTLNIADANKTELCYIYDAWDCVDSWGYRPVLCSDSENLYFTLSKHICVFDISANKANIVFSPELSKNQAIIGFRQVNDSFKCFISNRLYNGSIKTVSYSYNPKASKKCKIDLDYNSDYGTVSGEGVFSVGKTVTLKAKPEYDYRFVGYYIDGKKVTSSSKYSFKASKNLVVNAVFKTCIHKYTKSPNNNKWNGYCETCYTCKYCKRSYYNINSTQHKWVKVSKTKPSKSAVGYTTYKCSKCKAVCKHNYKSPTGKVKELYCKKKKSNSLTLSWSEAKGADGYQIQISKRNSKSWSKSKTITPNSVTFKKLSSKSKYRFRVRFYIKAGGKKCYSPWSSVKAFNTK